MLITLAIIGVVAALTIPTVVQKYKKIEIETKLKRIYSIMNNAIELSIANNTWDEPPTELRDDADALYDWLNEAIIPYLKVTDFVKSGDENNKCEKYMVDNHSVCIEFLDGSYMSLYNNRQVHVFYILNNSAKRAGVTYFRFFIDYNTTGLGYFYPSGYNYAYKNDEDLESGKRSDIYVYGNRDGMKEHCYSKYSKAGSTCALLIMTDGWKIADDYPIKI